MDRTRRQLLNYAALATAVSAVGIPRVAPTLSLQSDLSDLSASQVVERLRRGDFSAESYAQHVLQQCEARKDLNTLISLDAAQVLEGARQADLRRRSGKPLGRLHGLPVPVKDSINTHLLPTTSGTGALRGFHPNEDAPLIRQLTGQGALVLGKTNLMEMSLGWTSNNKLYGAVHNPYDVTRIPGGSSGGSAAAVAARIAPLAIGEDTLGSIRVPAALCGVCGLRPTVSRYPSSGVMPITPRWDAPGPMARHVADLILFDAAIMERDTPLRPSSLSGLRIAVPPEYLAGLDSEVERVTGVALRKLEQAGATLVHAALPEAMRGERGLVSAIQSFEIIGNQLRYLRDSGSSLRFEEFVAGMSPAVQARYHSDFMAGGANAISEPARDELLLRLASMRRAMHSYFADHKITVLACPPTLTAALPIGEDDETEIGGVKVPLREAMARNAGHGSAVGMACLVLPAGLTHSGLPVGIGFDMLPGRDEELLSLGLTLEQVLGPIPAPAAAAI
ncbi:MAG TPA: amidase family protein [Steroidobacteraceae bacterium]|nr:amidase family protein [Steroidobacteraceae bacterium]